MTSQSQISPPTLLHKLSFYVVLGALILVMGASGIMKFTSNETIVANFSKWNLMDWKNIIGATEIILVVLLAIPRTMLLGTLGITGILGGAIYIHISHEEPFFFPAMIVVVCWINFLVIKPKKS